MPKVRFKQERQCCRMIYYLREKFNMLSVYCLVFILSVSIVSRSQLFFAYAYISTVLKIEGGPDNDGVMLIAVSDLICYFVSDLICYFCFPLDISQ